jgi:hypothetical protein
MTTPDTKWKVAEASLNPTLMNQVYQQAEPIFIRTLGRQAQFPDIKEFSQAAEVWSKGTLFHEFLHAVGADTYSHERHRRHASTHSRDIQIDGPYACAAQAFPGRPLWTEDSTREPIFAQTFESCLACASVRLNRFLESDAEFDLEPSSLSNAVSYCERATTREGKISSVADLFLTFRAKELFRNL